VTRLAITGIGAVTPVGLSAPASAAALRAGIARLGPIASSPEIGEDGELVPANGGRVPLEWLHGKPEDALWPGHQRWEAAEPLAEVLYIDDGPQRLVDLALPALREALARAGLRAGFPANCGLFVGLDEAEDEAAVLGGIAGGMGGPRPGIAKAYRTGRAAALEAIHRAAERVERGEIAVAIAGGVDSLVRPSVYARLDAAERLASEANPQGVRAGEAAAFVVITKRADPSERAAELLGSGIADELTAGTDRPCQGDALSLAIRAARRGASDIRARPLAICDLNGDRYRALEWGLAMMRSLSDLIWRDGGPGTGEFWHPADCTGDTGAAAGALCCVWAVEALRKGYARGENVLVWGASDGPRRAALIVSRAG